eukprot:COSAG01_NODE_1311_length_10774_cov_18.218299_9_plen_64_part_00
MPTKQAEPNPCLHPKLCQSLNSDNRLVLCPVCMAQSDKNCTRVLETVKEEIGMEPEPEPPARS